ncbi:MAG TPA: glycosyltransferase family 2 protein [Solirubrobacteraceae bacterium]|nr:glycosyltransferase family 2 protein [Solirubrobacteraceae bacterium]
MKVRAVVPCHAEAPDAALLARVARAVDGVLVVDDGLPPGEAARLDGAAVLRLGANHGKGTAVARGAERAVAEGADAVLVVDGDGQHPPSAIPAFLEAARDAELVIGNRFGDLGGIPLVRRAANLAASAALAVVARRRVADSQCGMRLLRGRALHEVPPPTGGFEAETLHLKRCLRAGVPVAWVPIPAIYDGERSSFRPLRDAASIAWALVAR